MRTLSGEQSMSDARDILIPGLSAPFSVRHFTTAWIDIATKFA
jgi:hypothetical protein